MGRWFMRSGIVGLLMIGACVDDADPDPGVLSCSISVSPAGDMTMVGWKWNCPIGQLAHGTGFVSRSGASVVISGGTYACGSSTVVFVAASGQPLVASGDIASAGVGPVRCAVRS